MTMDNGNDSSQDFPYIAYCCITLQSLWAMSTSSLCLLLVKAATATIRVNRAAA
jgi:hypothetical protein